MDQHALPWNTILFRKQNALLFYCPFQTGIGLSVGAPVTTRVISRTIQSYG